VIIIFIKTTNTSALELILAVKSSESLLLSKKVNDTVTQIMMKIKDITIANVAWMICVPVQQATSG
jgi:hypothetical protein